MRISGGCYARCVVVARGGEGRYCLVLLVSLMLHLQVTSQQQIRGGASQTRLCSIAFNVRDVALLVLVGATLEQYIIQLNYDLWREQARASPSPSSE